MTCAGGRLAWGQQGQQGGGGKVGSAAGGGRGREMQPPLTQVGGPARKRARWVEQRGGAQGVHQAKRVGHLVHCQHGCHARRAGHYPDASACNWCCGPWLLPSLPPHPLSRLPTPEPSSPPPEPTGLTTAGCSRPMMATSATVGWRPTSTTRLDSHSWICRTSGGGGGEGEHEMAEGCVVQAWICRTRGGRWWVG